MKLIIVIVTYCMMSWKFYPDAIKNHPEGLREELVCDFHKDFSSYEEGCIFYNKMKKNKDVSNLKFYNASACDTVPNFKKEFVYKQVTKK